MTRTNLNASVGLAEETTFGTYRAPTVHLPFESESLSHRPQRIESESIRAGRKFMHTDDSSPGRKDIGGDLALSARASDMGLLFKHALGVAGSASGGAGRYIHTYTPGDLYNLGLTAQVGRPDSTGAIRPFSYTGCKVNQLRIAASEGDAVQVTASLLARDVTTAETLVTPAYTASNAKWTFIHGALTVGGVAQKFKSVEVRYDNRLEADFYGGSDLTEKPTPSGFAGLDISGEVRFDSLDLITAANSGTAVPVLLVFTRGLDILRLTMNARSDHENPTVQRLGRPLQQINLKGIGTSDAQVITMQVENSQATAA